MGPAAARLAAARDRMDEDFILKELMESRERIDLQSVSARTGGKKGKNERIGSEVNDVKDE